MKKKLIALLAASAMVLGAGVIMAGCNNTPAEPEHTTHYDVNADGVCDKCGEDMAGHKHIYSKKWEFDADYHWHKATCAHSDETNGKEAHTYNSVGICTACQQYDQTPVTPVDGVYHFEAEHAILDDKDAGSQHVMVVEVDRHEFTESGKTDGPLVTDIGYFGGQSDNVGQTITWKFTAAAAGEVELTLRISSAVGSWSDRKIDEIDLNEDGAPTLKVNNADISLEGKKLEGLSDLTQGDMQSGVAYSNFTDVELTINLVAGENTVVLTSGAKGCNVDKIMVETTIELSFVKTNNSSRA